MILMILVESQVAVSNLCYVSAEDWLLPIAGTGGLRVLACGGFGNQLPLSNLLNVQSSSFQIRPVPRQNDHCCFMS